MNSILGGVVCAGAIAACGGAAPSGQSTVPSAPASPAAPVPTPAPAAPAPSPAAPPPTTAAIDCNTAVDEGTALRTAGKLDDAATLLDRAVARCGNGHGLHNALGVVRAGQNRSDDAATEFIAELRDPHTAPETFANLHEIYSGLSAARKLEIAGLGASIAAPIKVPTIRFEYAWVGVFACPDAQGTVTSQALVNGKSGRLDLLRFTCPDGKSRETYFDYSDDPDEKALRDQLKALDPKSSDPEPSTPKPSTPRPSTPRPPKH